MIRKLDDISEISSGGTPSRKVKEYWDGTINWLKSQEVRRAFVYDTEEKISVLGMNRSSARKIYPPDTVVLALYGATAGEVALLKTSSTINQAIAALEGRIRECNNHFLFYSLMQNKERLLLETTGAAQQNLYLKMVKEFTIPLPSYEEQCRVASVLSWFDDLIENKKRQNEVLEKTAMAIFKSWFMDFEPFKDGEFVLSELGEIPKDWKAGRLIDISEIIMGQSPPSRYYNEDGEGLPFIQGKGQFGKYTPETTTFCSSEGKIAKPLDIIVTVRAPVGELNIADRDYVIGRGVASLRSKHWSFLFCWLRQNSELMKAYERGTTFEAITKQELDNFPMLLPPTSILEKFNSITEPLLQKILLNQKQITILRGIRDTLLPLLVFGRLRVEEI